MPDVFITLHNDSVEPDELVGVVPALRRLIEDRLGWGENAAVVQIFRPEWAIGYDDVDINVLSSPTAKVPAKHRASRPTLRSLFEITFVPVAAVHVP